MILRSLLAHYRRHPLQALFLLTGIVVANVLLVGTLLINAQARASYGEGERILGSGPVASIQNRSNGQAVDERDYIRLRRQGFVETAPVLSRLVRTADGESLEILGVDPFAFSGGTRAEGDSGFGGFPFPPYELWAAPGRLEQLGQEEGARIRLASGATLPPLRAVPASNSGIACCWTSARCRRSPTAPASCPTSPFFRPHRNGSRRCAPRCRDTWHGANSATRRTRPRWRTVST